MQAILSDENRSSYVSTDSGRILASGLSKETALKFAAVNSLIRVAQRVTSYSNASVIPESLREDATAALERAGVIAIADEPVDSIGE